MRIITADMLRELKACAEGIREFEEHFPNGVTFRDKTDAIRRCVAVADVFDWGWAAENLLSRPARAAYNEATAPARAAYIEVEAPAHAAYIEVEAPALAAYYEAIAPAQAAYIEARATAFAVAFIEDDIATTL